MFTIFTPTYNRAHTLPRLYESLISQDCKDFEWLIVDDGSSDNTEEVVRNFKANNILKIKFIKQANAGKHIAYNTALKNASREFIFTIDSDDYLKKGTLYKVEEIIKQLPLDFGGFTGIHFSDEVDYKISDYGNKTWLNDHEYQWQHPGEMTFIWRTEIAKQYPFPVFEGEKFCQESLVLRRILAKHKVLWTDHVLVGGNYMEDGLTANMWERMKKSPRYTMLNISERYQNSTLSERQKVNLAKQYWEIAKLNNDVPLTEKIKGIPLRYTLIYFAEKFMGKLGIK